MIGRRVVVTGMGMVSPIGHTVDETWGNILEGRSGAALIESFDTSAYSTRFSASVKEFDISPYLAEKEARKQDVFVQYGMVAGMQAMQDSGLEVTEENAPRIGCSIGSGIGGIGQIEKNTEIIRTSGPRRVSPFFVPGSIINMISGNLSVKYNLQGPNLAVVTACTSGTHNIGLGARLIALGDADAMLVGGAEMATTPVGLGGFAAARALSTRNDDPARASRPWDKDRDGFVLGDGAGVIMIEEYESAKARGAKIYAELRGFGMSGDAHHMTLPPENGRGAAASMSNAIKDAGIALDKISYINAHGTGTKANDAIECGVIRTVFGEHTDRLSLSSTKSMHGHALGGAGAIEMIACIGAVKNNIVPPTINYQTPDPACDLDVTPNEAKEREVKAVLSNAFAFGGLNSVLALKKFEG